MSTHGEQLIKLGDMIGDGLADEPGGRWIREEYRRVARAMGINLRPRAPRDVAGIDEKMRKRCREVDCPSCGATLKQTRSGSMRAKCEGCGARFQLLRRAR